MEVESVLSELSKLLCGYNYEVFLRRYKELYSPGAGAERYISMALGPTAVLGGSCSVKAQEVLGEAKESLLHAGDEAYGPTPSVLASEKFHELLASVLAHIEQAVSSATLIEQFWLKEGHPAYPVYWDFAFLIVGPLGVEVFIGSSSD